MIITAVFSALHSKDLKFANHPKHPLTRSGESIIFLTAKKGNTVSTMIPLTSSSLHHLIAV
jgi:hypothetical protein